MTGDGALRVWLLLGGARKAPRTWSRATLVAELEAWGVSRATAYRWAGDWLRLAPGEHPARVPERRLRTLWLALCSAVPEPE